MSKKISISGEIGWDYTSSSINDSLRAAKGEDLEIDIATPGGDVFDGIEIYNAIRDYKRTYPKSQILGSLKGLVASMGTYIASNPAFDLVTAEDNAVYMIHNPWSLAIGDYKVMAKQAEFLGGLADILAEAYVKRTGKSTNEIKSMMDSETWLFGSEMKAAGFVDEMIGMNDGDSDDKESKKKKALALARGSFDAMKRHAQEKTDAQKVAAMVQKFTSPAIEPDNTSDPVGSKGENMPEFKTVAEFQAGAPALAKEVQDQAAVGERARIVALLDMRKKYGDKVGAVAEVVDKAIAEGKKAEDITLAVSDLVLSAADSAPPLNTGANGSASGENAPNAPVAVSVNEFR